jgi:hypothetical protein
MHARSFLSTVAVMAGCSSSPTAPPPPPPPQDAFLALPPGCAGVVTRVSADGVTPYGPTYGQLPPAAPPPLAWLAPSDCLAVRVDAAPNNQLRLQLDGDFASGWAAGVKVDGISIPLTLVQIAPEVVEATVTTPSNTTAIEISATHNACSAARVASLRVFSDGQVAVVGYSSTDCDGGGGPRSLRRYKTGIEYVDASGIDQLRDAALRLRLARYRYLEDAPSLRRLGVILDDVAPGTPISSDQRTVDLYGYASLAIAAAQAQERELVELRARVRALETAVSPSARSRAAAGTAAPSRATSSW